MSVAVEASLKIGARPSLGRNDVFWIMKGVIREASLLAAHDGVPGSKDWQLIIAGVELLGSFLRNQPGDSDDEYTAQCLGILETIIRIAQNRLPA